MDTIDNMQYEMDFYDYYNEFEYNYDLRKYFEKKTFSIPWYTFSFIYITSFTIK